MPASAPTQPPTAVPEPTQKPAGEHPGDLLWSYKKGQGIAHAVLGDVEYAGTVNGHVYALAADSGELKWSYEIGDSVISPPSVSNC